MPVCESVGAGKGGATDAVDAVIAVEAVEVVEPEATEASVPDDAPLSLPMESEPNFCRSASRSVASEQKLRYRSTIFV